MSADSTPKATLAPHEVSLPSSLEVTPALAPASDPSPVLSELISPALEEADKGFELDAPVVKLDPLPECWGHRGASASFPENTRQSFIEACKAGADGIETDIHVTADNVLVMFHDPRLERTTDGHGLIHEQPWHGVLEHVRTKKAPHQPIPKFTEVIEVLMQYPHVKLNIDCKVENNPTKLFTLIKEALATVPEWETVLAPRIVLGLWHPKFIEPAASILPTVRRFCISMSIAEVRKYFYDKCHGFSVWYRPLASAEGQKFREDCARAGKEICTWTVNSREEMLQCARWGISAIISDKPELWRDIKRELEADRARALKPTVQSYFLPFFNYYNYAFGYEAKAREEFEYLEREGGKFDALDSAIEAAIQPIRPAQLI
jgi:phosphatidylglycerol phospholipase C